VAIDGIVYDVTKFLPSHPGGAQIIVNGSGKDASTVFHSFHKRAALEQVVAPFAVGRVDLSESDDSMPEGVRDTGDQDTHLKPLCSKAEVQTLVNIKQFAEESLKHLPSALIDGYINYGAEDEQSIRANMRGWERYTMRPRVLVDVSRPNPSTTILGGRVQLNFPVCVAPFASARAAHPDGECGIASAAAAHGVSYAISHYAGYPLPDIADAFRNSHGDSSSSSGGGGGGGGGSGGSSRWPGNASGLIFQVYPIKKAPPHAAQADIDEMDESTAAIHKMGAGASSDVDTGLDFEYITHLLDYIQEGGFEAIFLTVDTVNNGNRERTYKNTKWVLDIAEQGGMPTPRSFDLAPFDGQGSGNTASLSWTDVAWLRIETRSRGLCLVLKGVMTGEDTALAAAAGVDGVVVSNHGGRQLDGTDGTAECIEECVLAARASGTACEVYVDGGVRRGKDVFKVREL
jgi:L-lactate dehydrogenase (cytochrome)